jgi:hypothetical protein
VTQHRGRERLVDARLHLLSRQVLDVDGEPVRAVDDLELSGPDGEEVRAGREAHVTGILVGHLGTAVELTVSSDELDVDWVERWVRERVVARIPGGRHDPEAGS